MKIAVVGTGAMGSVYAVLFAEAGHDVWAIDTWPEHVDAINRDGLKLTGFTGDRTVEVKASTSVNDAGSCDMYVLALATKVDGVGPAAQATAPLLSPAGTVVTIQNGLGPRSMVSVQPPRRLRRYYRPLAPWSPSRTGSAQRSASANTYLRTRSYLASPKDLAPKWWGPDTRTKTACRCCDSVS